MATLPKPGSHTHIHMQSEYRLPYVGLTSGSDLSMLDVQYAWLEGSPAIQPCMFIQFAFCKRYTPLEDVGRHPTERSSVRNTAHNVTVPELSDGPYLGAQRVLYKCKNTLFMLLIFGFKCRCSTNWPKVDFFFFLYKPFGVFCQTDIILVFFG